jgi:hypothetical protein
MTSHVSPPCWAAEPVIPRQAQARGDLAILASHGRRALRVHLGGDVDRGLEMLARAVQEALAA